MGARIRYSAFISYNHADKGWATWLHRALETYRPPRRLRGRPSPFGPLGAKLPPVFRDRDELKAAPGLAQALGGAAFADPGAAWHIIGAGDFNGDGKSDILWQNSDGTPAIWEMSGLDVIAGGTLANAGASWHLIPGL